MDDGRGRLSLLGRRLPCALQLRVVAVAPAAARTYEEGEWRDAIVVIEGGRIELEWLSGSRRSFERGDVLWLVGLQLRTLHNPGREPAVLVAVSRRRGHPGTAADLPEAMSSGRGARLIWR